MTEQNETPGICWPLVRFVLALVVTLGGLYYGLKWYAAGYSVAAVITGAFVVGTLGGLYPPAEHDPPNDTP